MCFYQRYEKQNPCISKLKKCKPNFISDLNSSISILGSECKRDLGIQLEIAEGALDQFGVYVSQAWDWLVGEEEVVINFDKPGKISLQQCLCFINILPIYWMLQWNQAYMVHTSGFEPGEGDSVIPKSCPQSLTCLLTLCSCILTEEFTQRSTLLIRTSLIFLLTSLEDPATCSVLFHGNFVEQIDFCKKAGNRDLWKKSAKSQPLASVVLHILCGYINRLTTHFFDLNDRLLNTFELCLQILDRLILQILVLRNNPFLSFNLIEVLDEFLIFLDTILENMDDNSKWTSSRVVIVHKSIIILRKLVSFGDSLFGPQEKDMWFTLIKRYDELMTLQQKFNNKDSFASIPSDLSPITGAILTVKDIVQLKAGENAENNLLQKAKVLELIENFCSGGEFKRPKFKKSNDYFSKYNEIPNEIQFFNQVMTRLTQDFLTIHVDFLSEYHETTI